jgi:FtsZ-interacting cell division protein ZipA
MEAIKDFFTDLADNNLYIIIIVGAILLFAIIGFIADRKKKKKIEKSVEVATAPEPVVEANESQTEVSTTPVTEVNEEVTPVMPVTEATPVVSEPVSAIPAQEAVQPVEAKSNPTDENKYSPFGETKAPEVEEENPLTGLTKNFSFNQPSNSSPTATPVTPAAPVTPVAEEKPAEAVQEPIKEENNWE